MYYISPTTPTHVRRLAAALMLLLTHSATAVTITILDRTGNPVPDMAVVLTDLSSESPRADIKNAPYVVDQIGMAFKPKILVIPAGAEVQFPNSDTVSHHVYSFSRPNDFELPLYKGTPQVPVRFDTPGLITMGCNIHDHMLGYVVVVDTPYIGTTNARGIAALDNVPAGRYELAILHINGNDPALRLVKTTQLKGPSDTVTHQLDDAVPGPDDGSGGSLSWDEY